MEQISHLSVIFNDDDIRPITSEQWELSTPRTRDMMEQLCITPDDIGFVEKTSSDIEAEAQFASHEQKRQRLTRELIQACRSGGLDRSQRLLARSSHQPRAVHELPPVSAIELVNKINNLPTDTSSVETTTDPSAHGPAPDLSRFCLRVLAAQPHVRQISTKHGHLAAHATRALQQQAVALSRRMQMAAARQIDANARNARNEADAEQRLAQSVTRWASTRVGHLQTSQRHDAVREYKLRARDAGERRRMDTLRNATMRSDAKATARVEAVREDVSHRCAQAHAATMSKIEDARDRRLVLEAARRQQRDELSMQAEARAAAGMARAQTLRGNHKATLRARGDEKLQRVQQCEARAAALADVAREELSERRAAAAARVEELQKKKRAALSDRARAQDAKQQQVQTIMDLQHKSRHHLGSSIAHKYVEADDRALSRREELLETAMQRRAEREARRERVAENAARLGALEKRFLQHVSATVKEGHQRAVLASAEHEEYCHRRQVQTSQAQRAMAGMPVIRRNTRRQVQTPADVPSSSPRYPLLERKTRMAERQKQQDLRQISQFLQEKR